MDLEHPAALASEPVPWSQLRRVLVVRPDNVGDVLMSGPALRMVRAGAPTATLDVLASPAGTPAARLHPEVDGVLTASVSWQQLGGEDPGTAGDDDLVARLAARRYDAAVLLTSFSQAPWPAAELCRRAGVRYRAGLSKEFGGPALTHWVPAPTDGGHQVDRGRYLCARLGLPETDHRLRVTPPEAGRRAALRLLGTASDAGLAVLVPGASCPSRRYRPERFALVARLLASDHRVVVAGTAGERDLVEQVAAGAPGALPLAGDVDLAGLAGLLAAADVVVANNSGAAHLADAVGTPVVVLFAGTERPEEYAPRSVPAAVLGVPTACRPCRQLVCPFAHECLELPAAVVAGHARALADGSHGAHRSTPSGSTPTGSTPSRATA